MAGAVTTSVRRDGDALAFAGPLLREACATAWKQALPLLDGARRIDLAAVGRIDSAGLALLAELAERAGIDAFDGRPAGLDELRSAYRLDSRLGYAG